MHVGLNIRAAVSGVVVTVDYRNVNIRARARGGRHEAHQSAEVRVCLVFGCVQEP